MDHYAIIKNKLIDNEINKKVKKYSIRLTKKTWKKL